MLSKEQIEQICRNVFRELSISKDCSTITHALASKNNLGASKMLEVTLVKAISGCLYEVLQKSEEPNR